MESRGSPPAQPSTRRCSFAGKPTTIPGSGRSLSKSGSAPPSLAGFQLEAGLRSRPCRSPPVLRPVDRTQPFPEMRHRQLSDRHVHDANRAFPTLVDALEFLDLDAGHPLEMARLRIHLTVSDIWQIVPVTFYSAPLQAWDFAVDSVPTAWHHRHLGASLDRERGIAPSDRHATGKPEIQTSAPGPCII